MHADFWHERWQRGEIAFHEGQPNTFLVKYFDQLQLAPHARIFVPLCGKTVDIHWLLQQGYRVVGAELSPLAIDALFAELGVTPQITPVGELLHYAAPHLEVFVGDIFEVSAEQLGQVDAVYDRAALVALPTDLRARYAAHLQQMTATSPQLVVTFDYDQDQLAGPPFAISPTRLQDLYGKNYQLIPLDTAPLMLKGKVAATEGVWLLQPQTT